MSLMVLMYHRAQAGHFGNSPEMLDAHFSEVAKRAVNVLPGDKLARDRLNVCLSFDDGYFDFWAVVFPLLQKYHLRAVLAVSPGLIRESVPTLAGERRNLSTETAYAQPELGGFCTWSELEEMVLSGHVQIAAHGYHHIRLDAADADFATEIDLPQVVLTSRLHQTVNTFVFPYGRFSPLSLQRVRASYRYVFRIGSASNRDWNGRSTYRIPADRLSDPAEPFTPVHRAAYGARFWWNRCRGR